MQDMENPGELAHIPIIAWYVEKKLQRKNYDTTTTFDNWNNLIFDWHYYINNNSTRGVESNND